MVADRVPLGHLGLDRSDGRGLFTLERPSEAHRDVCALPVDGRSGNIEKGTEISESDKLGALVSTVGLAPDFLQTATMMTW